MSVLSIKLPIRKKSGNLFNDSHIYIYIYIYILLRPPATIGLECKNYYKNRKWGKAIGESSSPSNSGRSDREGGKGLDPNKEKTCHWSRQGRRFTAKKKRNPKS